MSALLDEIRSKGHWRIAIRPLPFASSRVDASELEETIAERQVQLRGWYVPHISRQEPIVYGEDWIAQESRFKHHLESWKFFTTGQFALVRGFGQDWRESGYLGSDFTDVREKRIQVWAVLYFFTEVLELSSRLALSPVGSDQMNLRITTAGLAGRQLVIEDPARSEFDQMFISGPDEVVFEEELTREELAANSAEIAVRASQQVFRSFGWRVDNLAILMDYQAGFLKR